MRSKIRIYMAAVVATAIGLPLAEPAKADGFAAWDITTSALGLAGAITSAAVGWS